MSGAEISELQQKGVFTLEIAGQQVEITRSDVEILTDDIPGWLVATEGAYTVALDITLNEALLEEGLARELVNKIQNLRKTKGLEVSDRIDILLKSHPRLPAVVERFRSYICAETLGNQLELTHTIPTSDAVTVELTDELSTEITITKIH